METSICEDYAGLMATLAEMSEPDWQERLAEAERDSQAGRGVRLEEFKARQAQRGKSHIVVEESRQNRRAARSLNRFLDALGDKQISPQS